VDPDTLKDKSWREVHVRLQEGIAGEDELYDLRDLLFETPGPCSIWFHVPVATAEGAEGKAAAGAATEVVVRANPQITCSYSEEALDRIRETRAVVEAWRD
jgi:hypothetical protein